MNKLKPMATPTPFKFAQNAVKGPWPDKMGVTPAFLADTPSADKEHNFKAIVHNVLDTFIAVLIVLFSVLIGMGTVFYLWVIFKRAFS